MGQGRSPSAVSVFLVIAVSIVVAALDASTPGAGGTLFVTERQNGTVTAFDARTGVPLWTGATGASPIGVTQPHGTGRVYTSDEGSNQMTVLDADTGEPLRSIAMGPLPHHLMASPNGKFVYVAEFGHNRIGVVDTTMDVRVDGLIANPLVNARTHAVWVTRDGKDLYATNSRVNRAEVGDVAHLDLATGDLCNTEVGADPSEVLVRPDGRVAYVSVRRENKVKELDLSTTCPALTGREAVVGTQPDTLQLTNDGKTLIVTLRGTPAQISFLDVESFTVTVINIPGHTTTGHHWLSADGNYSFVAVESPAGVAVVDNRTGTTLDDYPYPNPPGGSRAHGVFYIPGR